MAARVKLAPERVVALEAERDRLPADGRGRALARSLALAIGADPGEASGQLGPAARPSLQRPLGPTVQRVSAPRVLAALVIVLGLWVAGEWWIGRSAGASGARVQRPDYLGALLGTTGEP